MRVQSGTSNRTRAAGLQLHSTIVSLFRTRLFIVRNGVIFSSELKVPRPEPSTIYMSSTQKLLSTGQSCSVETVYKPKYHVMYTVCDWFLVD